MIFGQHSQLQIFATKDLLRSNPPDHASMIPVAAALEETQILWTQQTLSRLRLLVGQSPDAEIPQHVMVRDLQLC
jgi:hypothetical protein